VDGFLNLHKLADWTSHDCVAKVRRILGTKKVGHGGTLDPAAVGVLPIAIGTATKLLQYLPAGKAYRAVIRLGIQTTTDDLEGEIVYSEPARDLTLDRIQAVIPEFIGKIQQTPPIYSAIKVDGQRLYQLARAGETGETVQIPTREVEIDRIEILNWTPGEFPEIEVQIACGGGTYIRSIARDLGSRLGTRGVLAFLERNASCGFKLADSITLEELEQQQQAGIFTPISPNQGLVHLPAVALTDESLVKCWSQGQKIPLDRLTIPFSIALASMSYVRVVVVDRCVGIGAIQSTELGLLLIPQKVFSHLPPDVYTVA
jgi:tRNA pseudouridine55 synthase